MEPILSHSGTHLALGKDPALTIMALGRIRGPFVHGTWLGRATLTSMRSWKPGKWPLEAFDDLVFDDIVTGLRDSWAWRTFFSVNKH